MQHRDYTATGWRGAAMALLLAPVLHPLLRPWVGVPSHLLWWVHVVPVAVAAYSWGAIGAAVVLSLSTAGVLVGERAFGNGYGVPAPWETAIALAVALATINVLVAGYADYARRAARRLHLLGYRDELTGLPNRRALVERLERELGAAHRGTLALLFIDVDDFKVVNDSLGHAAGDRVLVETGLRLQRCLQGCDTLARWAGDEFVLLVHRSGDLGPIVDLAGWIHRFVAEPMTVEAQELVLTASIGIALADSGQTADQLLREADTAMHHAKSAGKGKWAVFDERMHQRISSHLQLAAELRAAIGRGEIFNEYQPIHCIQSGRVCGLEALARWSRGPDESVPPDQFIPVAEATGLIRELGRGVLERGLHDLAAWTRATPTAAHCFLSVNLSVVQLRRRDLAADVAALLERHGVPPERLVLEITESLFMDRSPRIHGTVERLVGLGVRLAIDDFGSGYSSLGYLRRLPAHMLKIDRSLLNLDDGLQSRSIVGPVVQMARTLGLQVVAEGIERFDQLAAVRSHGAQYAQGFLLSRPMRAGKVLGLLTGHHSADDPIPSALGRAS